MTTQTSSKIVTFDNILFATDFSKESNIALPFALSIAHKYGSKIFAVHVLAPPPLGNFPTIEVQALAAQALREAHESAKELGRRLGAIPHETDLRRGDIWDELSTVTKEKNVDLIVLGTHGRAGVSKLLIGSVAERIFRQSTCPVLTVGPNVSGEPKSIADIHTILCPIDFTAASLAAFPYAVSLAQENQARLYLMNVVPVPVLNYEESSLRDRLKALVPPEANLWCEPKAFVESGDAGDKILEQAEELGVDLIVLGIRPVSTLAGTRTHLGTATAYKVVSRALCPVLSVRGETR
ncbi:MAG: universal stress protein [Candidatus Acidiferrales bacterium]